MGIQYFEQERIFKLDTKSSSYAFAIIGEDNFVAHLYYGRKLASHRLAYLLCMGEPVQIPAKDAKERGGFMESYAKEYAYRGYGDCKEAALEVKNADGTRAINLCYKSHEIYSGKKGLKGLPATFGSEAECTTLEVLCEDPDTKVQVVLSYTAFEDTDAIARSVKVINGGNDTVYLTRALSASLELENNNFDVMGLYGDWSREGQITRYPLGFGGHTVECSYGKSGHHFQPFIAVLDHDANYDRGEVYAMHFVYSGNFLAKVSMSIPDAVRMVIGIHPTDFEWRLEPGEEFVTPEAILVHSTEGIGGMTHSLHDLYRNHLIRGKYAHTKRPILINNWEATYFNFNTDKLVDIAKEASKLGIEMLVMDDGWFGKRVSDDSSLGDWFVNEEKLPGGLAPLVEQVNALGMKFGIWFEPEMVCPDSDLFRAHPDWAIALPGRVPGRKRNQLVLDMTRQEVVDAVYKMVSDVLHSANVEYVKWDMNRSISEIYSATLPAERMGEFYHRYMLGVYQLQERLITEFPDLLLENCSSGGGRFDPGMLYYSPQIWTSDDTDGIERLSIQEGMSMLYPLSSIGAHVSDCPNHTIGRSVPFETRGYVAMSGTFGYELDVTRIPQEDRDMIPAQVEMYHKYNHIVREGDYYRIDSLADTQMFDSYMSVTKDKTEALLTHVRVVCRLGEHARTVRLKGLDPDKVYEVSGENRTYTGEELMYAGLKISYPWAAGDFRAKLIHICECKE